MESEGPGLHLPGPSACRARLTWTAPAATRWTQARRSLLRALASGPLSQPIIAGKRVNRHRLARAPVASAAYRESELGCHAAGCFVSPVRDVRRDRLDVGAAVEIVDRRFHRFVAMPSFAGPRSPTSPPRLRRGRCPRCRRRRDAARRSRGSSCPACPGRPTGRSRARATGHRPRGCRARRPLHSSMHEHGRTRRGLSAGEASAVPFEDWFLPGQAPAGRSRSVHPRAEYDRPDRVTFPNTGPRKVLDPSDRDVIEALQLQVFPSDKRQVVLGALAVLGAEAYAHLRDTTPQQSGAACLSGLEIRRGLRRPPSSSLFSFSIVAPFVGFGQTFMFRQPHHPSQEPNGELRALTHRTQPEREPVGNRPEPLPSSARSRGYVASP